MIKVSVCTPNKYIFNYVLHINLIIITSLTFHINSIQLKLYCSLANYAIMVFCRLKPTVKMTKI